MIAEPRCRRLGGDLVLAAFLANCHDGVVPEMSDMLPRAARSNVTAAAKNFRTSS